MSRITCRPRSALTRSLMSGSPEGKDSQASPTSSGDVPRPNIEDVHTIGAESPRCFATPIAISSSPGRYNTVYPSLPGASSFDAASRLRAPRETSATACCQSICAADGVLRGLGGSVADASCGMMNAADRAGSRPASINSSANTSSSSGDTDSMLGLHARSACVRVASRYCRRGRRAYVHTVYS